MIILLNSWNLSNLAELFINLINMQQGISLNFIYNLYGKNQLDTGCPVGTQSQTGVFFEYKALQQHYLALVAATNWSRHVQ